MQSEASARIRLFPYAVRPYISVCSWYMMNVQTCVQYLEVHSLSKNVVLCQYVFAKNIFSRKGENCMNDVKVTALPTCYCGNLKKKKPKKTL
jgi:hypothetical protein